MDRQKIPIHSIINNSRYQNILKGLGLEEKDLKYKVTRDFNINEKDNWSILTNKQQVSSIMGAKPFVINTPDNFNLSMEKSC